MILSEEGKCKLTRYDHSDVCVRISQVYFC